VRILDHFILLTIAEYGILDLFLFLILPSADFYKTLQNDDANKAVNTRHFGSELADIRINPEIHILILHHFLWTFRP